MARKELENPNQPGITFTEVIGPQDPDGRPRGHFGGKWRPHAYPHYDGDRLTLTTHLEDGSVAEAELWLGDDGTVRSRYTLTSPDTTDVTEGLPWVRSMIRPDVAQAWDQFIYGPSNWLQLTDEFRTGLRPRHPGRKGMPVADLALLVERYVTACVEDTEPMERLRTLYYPDEPKARLNQRLRRAQELGLFTGRPGRGRAGGEMTDKCRRVRAGEEV